MTPTSTTGAPPTGVSRSDGPQRVGSVAMLARSLALFPPLAIAVLFISRPRSFTPAGPPILELLAALFFTWWALTGAWMVWRTTSPWIQALALVVFGGGAVLGTLLMPAILSLLFFVGR